MKLCPSINKINIPCNLHFTDELATLILTQNSQQLPDLNNICIFLPNSLAVKQVKYSLARISQKTLLGGYIGSHKKWLLDNIQQPGHSSNTIHQATRQLLLFEALKDHPDLFSEDNHWQVCDSLLDLFDELNLSQHSWLNAPLDEWIKQLKLAYQCNESLHNLNQEANIIYTLWVAWQEQLQALGINDEGSRLKSCLLSAIPKKFKSSHFYIVGIEQLSTLEIAWCEKLSSHASVTWITQESIDNPSNASGKSPELALLQSIYHQSDTFFNRTQAVKNQPHHLFLNHIKLIDTQSTEQQTRAVDLKVRMSLLEGHKNIAVVTENRKLARRLRALLERANIKIQDTAGWALATTSAASVLERWLLCIEQDFAYQSLLDLLKSPFFCAESDFEEHLNLIYYFEKNIILHENIANDLNRYKTASLNRDHRLKLKPSQQGKQLLSLIELIQESADNLLQLFSSKQLCTPDRWINSLISSIQQLGLYAQLSKDLAGQRIIEELQRLSISHLTASPEMNWSDFRIWLSSALEREQFKPTGDTSTVKIMNLQQAQYCQFDSLIIAGANIKSFPGSPSQHAFFNQSVRQALQLDNWHDKKLNSFIQFQQLLLASSDILITWQSEENGEWLQASPWVSSLEDFSTHAFNLSLQDAKLKYLLSKLASISNRSEQLINHLHAIEQPKPCIIKQQIPAEFSASRHQRLIDCPYKFFASDILKLKVLEQISQQLLKSEYGEKVHLILQAFHQQCPGLSPPFSAPLNKSNRDKALQHIKLLSAEVFKMDLEDSIQHRGWLDRWMQTAAAYIDWQIERQCEWQIHQLELQCSQPLNKHSLLTGRLDRVDIKDNQLSIIDYKTGATARQADIESAENIQLTSYAALLSNVANVIYLKLDKGEVKQAAILENEGLIKLKTDTLQRLDNIINQLSTSTPLPAWGDTKTCGYCDMSGLCRKQMWEI